MATIKVKFDDDDFIEITGDIYDNFIIPLPNSSLDKNYKIKELVGTDVKFTVNLYKMQCTCPDFVTNRVLFEIGSVKRMCLHLKEAYCFLCKDLLNNDLIYEFFVGVKTIRPWHLFLDFEMLGHKALFHFEPECHNTTSFVILGDDGVYKTVSYNYKNNYWLDRNSKHLNRLGEPMEANIILSSFSKYITRLEINKG